MGYYTHIDHDLKKQLQITANEYMVLDAVYRNSNRPEYPFCTITCEKMANAFDISKVSVVNILSKLEAMGYIKKNEKGHKRATSKIYKAFDALKELQMLGKESLPQLGKESFPSFGKESLPVGKESLPQLGKESFPNSKNIDSKKNSNKIKLERAPEIEKDACLLAVEENRKKLTTLQNVQAPFESDKCKQLWADWQEHLKEKGKNPSRVTLEKHCRDLRMHPESVANAMIEQAIAKGWCSIYPLDKKEEQNPNRMPKQEKKVMPSRNDVRGRMGSNFD